VESVILPYWRHRWRLYEVWALTYVLTKVPSRYRTRPLLESRADGSGALDWVIPHGDAHSPVGEIAGRNASLLVWFQRKTSTLAGLGHIEPDIRVMTDAAEPGDVFILELKDRYNVSTSYIKKVATAYAEGSLASHVCITNYGPFRSEDLRGKLTVLPMSGKEVLLADHFRPGNVEPRIGQALADAVRTALPEKDYALIVDVSGSVENFDVRAQAQAVTGKLGQPCRAFTFRDKLAQASVPFTEEELVADGGTDLPRALTEFFEGGYNSGVSETVVLTDRVGARQLSGWPENAVRPHRITVMTYGASGAPVPWTQIDLHEE
jgi:hypothetical protein